MTASNVLANATITVGGITPAHITLSGVGTGTQTFTLKGGGLCKGLPGAIVITNPLQSGQPTTCVLTNQPFTCNETCPK